MHCILSLCNKLCQGGNLPKSSHLYQNCFGKSVVAGCVLDSITPCSSGVLRWGWSIWKANMMPFNFDVHCWNWFMLDLSEKSLYFLVFSCCQGSFEIFSKCWKIWHFLISLDFAQSITWNPWRFGIWCSCHFCSM